MLMNMVKLIRHLQCGARDRDLWGVAAVLWLVSLVRVVLGLAHHEVFGVEATAAFACVALIPGLFIARKDASSGEATTHRQTSRERPLPARQ